MIRTRRAIVSAALVGCALFTAEETLAHLMLQKSEPAHGTTITAPPTQVRLWFSEQVDLAVSKVAVTGPSGTIETARLQSAEAKGLTAPITGSMPDGAYKVSWQTAGDDGHIEKGVVAFNLKRSH